MDPIGDDDHRFQGKLDGKGFKITNLSISRADSDNVGLFGYLSTGSELNHLILENVDVVGQTVGGLVGFNEGTIDNSYTTGEVSATYTAGGLIGYNTGTISNSYSTGSISAWGQTAGGLVGTNTGSISSSYAIGSVESLGMNAGGLIGHNQGTVSNSYARGSVTGHSRVGGLVGANYSTAITNSYATGAVIGTSEKGGLVGYYHSGPINNSFYDSGETGEELGKGVGKKTSDMKIQSTYTNSTWNFSDTWAIDENKNDGYPILRAFYLYVNYDGNDNTEGDVPVDSKSYLLSEEASIAGNTGNLEKSGYTFMGWNTSADGSGTSYDPADTFTITENLLLYATWLSSAATLESSIGTVSTGGTASETITAIPYGTTLSALEDAITLAANATYEIYDADGTTPATTLATGKKIVVTAQDGTTRVTYTVSVIAVSTVATLTSTIGTVSTTGTAAETITAIPYGTTLSQLENAITLATYATYEIYDADGTTPATTLATGKKVIVTAQDGTTTVTYTVTVNAAPSTAATLTSTIGTVSTGGTPAETITAIPYGTTLSALENAITLAANATYEIYDTDGTTPATTLATGKKVIVTAQDGTTTVTYTVSVIAVSTAATLTSTIGTVSIGGTAAETITAIPYGTTLSSLENAITPAMYATYEIYDADGTTPATTLATGKKVIVTAQDGTTTVTYTVSITAASTVATLTSTIGTVSTGGTAAETITAIPYGTTLSALENAITLAANATYEIYDADGTTPATTLATGKKVIVTAQDGTTTVTYTVTVNVATQTPTPTPTPTPTIPPTIPLVSQQVNPTTGGVVSFGNTSVNIPAGATGSGINVTITNVNPETLKNEWKPNPSQEVLVSDVFEISKNTAGNFTVPIVITLPFDMTKVDTARFNFFVFWLNESLNLWTKLDNTLVDMTKGTVSGSVNHFTKFAVLAEEKVVEKPNEEIVLSDVSGHWAQGSITSLIALKAIQGYKDGTFKPNNHITRAEFTTILVNALALPMTGQSSFTDTGSHWANNAIAAAHSNGIVNGYGDDSFKPDNLITREQMAAMIVKAFKLDAKASSRVFTDQSKISVWAQKDLSTAVEYGIFGGYVDGTIKPLASATRAEAATVIVKALQGLNN